MKLRYKLLIGLVPAAVFTAVLVGIGSYSLIRSAVEERYLERLSAESALVADWLAIIEERREIEPGPMTTHVWAQRWGQLLEAHVTLVAGDGRVIGDSSLTWGQVSRLENFRDKPEVRLAMREGTGDAVRTEQGSGETYYYLARRVLPSSTVASVRLALPESKIRETEAGYLYSALGLSLLSLLVLTALSYTGSIILTRPFAGIAEAATAVAEGDLKRRVPTGSTWEMNRLSGAINNMRDSLVDHIRQLETRQALLDSVVSGMRGGVMVIGANGVVLLANDSVGPILRTNRDFIGCRLSEVVRVEKLLSLVAETLLDGQPRNQRIEGPGGDDRYFDAHVTSLPGISDDDKPGALVLLYDITRIEALEVMRKEFVADVSHELRTPLTSIRAAATTLLDGAMDDESVRERFLSTITRHTERMSALLDDLTDLSRIETGAISLELERVVVAPVVRELVAQLEPRHVDQDIEVIIDIDSKQELSVDRLRFEQIMTNLVENAMKFNRVGGTVRITGTGKVIKVQDSGPGIPAENVQKIFQRFFRLDPARSRERGGTGLGLAIVKHLMTLHGGSVRVESELGKGSTFILDFS